MLQQCGKLHYVLTSVAPFISLCIPHSISFSYSLNLRHLFTMGSTSVLRLFTVIVFPTTCFFLPFLNSSLNVLLSINCANGTQSMSPQEQLIYIQLICSNVMHFQLSLTQWKINKEIRVLATLDSESQPLTSHLVLQSVPH